MVKSFSYLGALVVSFIGSYLAVQLALPVSSSTSDCAFDSGSAIANGKEISASNVAGKIVRSTKLYGCATPIIKGVPPFNVRGQLGAIVQSENVTRGAELDVQSGLYSASILRQWPNAQEYLLVDLWAQQENYKDVANVDNARQENNYQDTLKNTNNWAKKRRVCRNYTSVCVLEEADEYLDFIYVDARHDFKGVYIYI